MGDRVRRVLVTGIDPQLWEFHLAVAIVANHISERSCTRFYTVFDEHLEIVRKAAEQYVVTLQEIVFDDDGNEAYPVLVGRAEDGWPAPIGEDGRRCRECGCTTLRACPGGCSWESPDLCSACAGHEE